MKLPSFGWKFNAAVLSVVFLAGCFIGQAPFREIMPKEDADLLSGYWLAHKVKMHGVAASIRQSNALKFEANGWKDFGGVQIAQAGKP